MKRLEEEITNVLNKRKVGYIENDKLILSAVLIPMLKDRDAYSLLFTKRPRTMKRHAGQISFPGGIYEKSDRYTQMTAIRETCEELGLNQKNIKILGRLDDLTIRTGYLVTPFVGLIYPPNEINVNKNEIEEIITIPITDLMKISPRIKIIESTYPIYYYDYRNHVIWGATARILKNFLEILKMDIAKGN